MLTLGLLLQVSALARVDDPVRTHQDIVQYAYAISVPDTGTMIAGRGTIRYRVATADGALVLDLDDAMRVDAVQSGGAPVEFIQGGDSVVVEHWGAIGDTLEIVVHYTGRPEDGLFIRTNARGRRSVFADNWPNRARGWIPAEDHPSDKASVTWAIEVPAGWRVIANGDSVGVDRLADGRTVWRYEEPRPVATYNYVFGAGELAVAAVPSTRIPQSVWTFAEDSVFAVDGPFRRIDDIVTTIADVVGPFPYGKLAHVQSSTRFGGMENAGAIFYAEQSYVRQTLGEGTVVHEIAHQWFGDAVTEYDWHHLWLSEGFATYFAALYYDLKGERETFATRLDRMREGYLGSTSVEQPILDFDQVDYLGLLNANNYQKGGLVLHMLRRTIGDSAFLASLATFYARHRDSTALSADFQAIAEEIAGRDLETFFTQWLTQPGYPMLEVVAQRLDDGRLRLDVAQIQPEAWGVYVADVRIDVVASASGEREQVIVPLRGRSASVTLVPPAAGDRVDVDPAGDLLLVARTSWRD